MLRFKIIVQVACMGRMKFTGKTSLKLGAEAFQMSTVMGLSQVCQHGKDVDKFQIPKSEIF